MGPFDSKKSDYGESYTVRCFTICNVQVLLGWWNKKGWHLWGTCSKYEGTGNSYSIL